MQLGKRDQGTAERKREEHILAHHLLMKEGKEEDPKTDMKGIEENPQERIIMGENPQEMKGKLAGMAMKGIKENELHLLQD